MAVAFASLLVLLACVVYVVSPPQEALGVDVATITSAPGQESIEGWVFSKYGGSFVVRVFRRRLTRRRLISTLRLGSEGFFYIHVTPGRYEVVFTDRGARAVRKIRVLSGQTKYFLVKVRRKPEGFGIAPVMFNY